MSRPALAALALLLCVPSVSAQEPAAPPGAPSGLTASVSLAAGGELGLEDGEDAGLGELELAVGWEIGGGLRPEVAFAAGVAPDGHVALRPGVRWAVPQTPFALRVAADASNARDGGGLRLRWLLVGLAAEIRFTSLLGLYAEVDSGAPLDGDAGLPLLVRAGATLRF